MISQLDPALNPLIVGCGLVTPLGRTVAQNWRALLAGQSITDHARVEGIVRHPSRVTSLAIEAAAEAMLDAGWRDASDHIDTAIIVGTSKGPVENWLTTPPPSIAKSDNQKVPAGRSNFGLAGMAKDLADHIGLTSGPRLTLSAACASGLHALIRGCMMIQTGETRRVLVVAAEASVHPLFIASFNRLGVLPPAGVPCRPFDLNRQGFLMSDAAAAVCLEASNKPGVCVDRYTLGGDATHLTGSKSDGAVLAHLLRQVMPRDVDLIHAHGTGTVLNDATELTALEAQCVETIPHLYSHKGSLGHSLGASGLVSVVINRECHRAGTVPGNANTAAPCPRSKLEISGAAAERNVCRSIAIASGFGGPTAVIGFRSI
jgi:3-oxoacyl-[acyl-carrier-protein] synthase II